ncbi:MAG: hypothetical protein AB4050_11860 [Synechococcus sp.]
MSDWTLTVRTRKTLSPVSPLGPYSLRQMANLDSSQPTTTDPPPEQTQHLIRAIANRLRQTENHRRDRLIRYARLRTRIKGPAAASAFPSKSAAGTQQCCTNCQYFADIPQMVCALHPEGPSDLGCSDCIPHSEVHI